MLVDLITGVARICHAASSAYGESIGEPSQPSWNDAPEWLRRSVLNGVQAILDGRVTTPSQSHENWLREKFDNGWRYGLIKDPEKKEHPCMVAYAKLPREQQTKDALFFAIVKAAIGEATRV